MFRTNINRFIAREIHRTKLMLLRAQDEEAAATLRVAALAERLARLQRSQLGEDVAVRNEVTAAMSDVPADAAVPRTLRMEVEAALAGLARCATTRKQAS